MPISLGRFQGSSLPRTFAVLSLLTIAAITAIQLTVQWTLFRDDLLEWERTTTSEAIRRDARAVLSVADFQRGDSAEAQAHFAHFFDRTLANTEVLRVKVYGPDMRVIWSDEPRLRGEHFTDNDNLRRALRGETVAHLEQVSRPENVYEHGFGRTVELYVPVALSAGSTPGTARIAGVIEIYKDPSRMFANVTRDRFTIILTSVTGAAVLYAALFWIVYGASAQLGAQRADLERHTAALQQAYDELRATQRQLGAAERLAAIGEVSATVAHGIRNPLANIRAAAQVALSAKRDPALAESYLGAIIAESDRLRTWLARLLDAIRPFEPSAAPVDLHALVEAVIDVLAARLAEHEVAVARRLTAAGTKLLGDDIHLQQALIAVVENAIDAVPPGGHVEVGTEVIDAMTVRLTVRDNGAGIPGEQLGKIFDPFVTTKRHGTGLGLAIARKVVEGHGGRITVESTVGVGTTVAITLPLQPSVEGARA
jgi:two-component system, NtrC family, sensor histidine kinase HydH